ncbi:Sulfur carrier for synthesis of hydroxyethylthiazole phosphate [Bacillus licheniformis]|nr:Sulfur carrier for synthesis of hydroxyethylthiazole phosphate [Bacillus licheniformis]
MNIQLNGRKIEWRDDGGTIYDLLASYNLENRVVVVEKTGGLSEKTNIKRSNWKNTMSSKSFILSEGDKPLC